MTREITSKPLFFIILMMIAQGSYGQLPQKFDALFNHYFATGLFEGTALIADETGIVYQKSFGFADRGAGVPNQASTVFRLGSLEKQFTAMMIMQLVGKGRLALDGKISDYLPHYRKDTGKKVTIGQLLNHTSGIPNYTAFPNMWNDSLKIPYSSSHILSQFCSNDLEFEPGTKLKYSNSGYFILAQIIEKVTDKPLSVVLKENILLPAGMNTTAIGDGGFPDQDKALGYYRVGDTYINEPYIFLPNVTGSASLRSTVKDLYTWDRALYGNRLLSKELMKEYLSPHFEVEPGYSYGWGWEFSRYAVSVNDTVEVMEHSGAVRAFRSVIFRVPSEKKCFILLSNCANQSSYELFLSSMKIFRGIIWEKPAKLIADIMYPVMIGKGIEEGIEHYKKIKKGNAGGYDLSSSSLELLGERLLLLQKYAEASAVFQLAVEQYPEYVYGYFYLGRVYEKWGKTKEAIAAYQKAADKGNGSRASIDAVFQIKYLSGRE